MDNDNSENEQLNYFNKFMDDLFIKQRNKNKFSQREETTQQKYINKYGNILTGEKTRYR